MTIMTLLEILCYICPHLSPNCAATASISRHLLLTYLLTYLHVLCIRCVGVHFLWCGDVFKRHQVLSLPPRLLIQRNYQPEVS